MVEAYLVSKLFGQCVHETGFSDSVRTRQEHGVGELSREVFVVPFAVVRLATRVEIEVAVIRKARLLYNFIGSQLECNLVSEFGVGGSNSNLLLASFAFVSSSAASQVASPISSLRGR